MIRFACVSDDAVIEYAWNTEVFTGISVTSGLYNSEMIVEQYADVLEQWKKELEKSGGSGGGAVSSVNGKTGDVNLTASDVGAYTKAETKQFVEDSINSSHKYVILPAINSKADANLSNVTDEAFLTKLNMVLPDGDEVSY